MVQSHLSSVMLNVGKASKEILQFLAVSIVFFVWRYVQYVTLCYFIVLLDHRLHYV